MITLIGMGPGDRTALTDQARSAIQGADILIGAPRMLTDLPEHRGITATAYKTEEVFSLLTEREYTDACVLFSGDPGFWSGAEALAGKLERAGMGYRILPGLSSIQSFAARLGRSWKDWVPVSAHGRDADILYHLKNGRPVFLLTSGEEGPAVLCRTLSEAGLSALTVTVGSRLSYPDEAITAGPAGELAYRTFAPLNVVLVEAAPVTAPRTPGIPDGKFIRGQTPMTKQEVRAVILSTLAVGPSDICWDVGAGTGSVSVELALHGKEVWAVEHDPEACSLIRQNRERFCAWNLHLAEGNAPTALDGLPEPNVVFIGGSGGQLRSILRVAAARNPGVRVCVSAVTLETAGEAMDEMTALGMAPEAVQISVSRTRKAGEKHLLLAQNPVFLVSGGRS